MKVEIATRANMPLLLGELRWNVGRTQQGFLYSSLNDEIACIAGHLQPNVRVSQMCVVVLSV